MIIRTMLVLASVALAALSVGQNTAPTAVLLLRKEAVVGKPVKGSIRITFAPGLHGYQNPPAKDYMIPVKVESGTKGVTFKVTYPKGKLGQIAGEQAAVYEGTIELPIEITLPKKPGQVRFAVKISYQQCTNESCFPPDSLTLTGNLTLRKPLKTK